jgi:DNA adenine methylase
MGPDGRVDQISREMTTSRSERGSSRCLKRPVLSPLRYPGGKSYLYGTLRTVIRDNGLTSGTYVEPYAGGAGAALGLLITGQVSRIAINDLDPAIYAFWRAVVQDSSRFAEKLRDAKLDVEEWAKQRRVYLDEDRNNYLDLGFATFYLNRTNRSGALNAGPIGGQNQTGNYKIDARFNKGTLLERLRLIALHASRISVSNKDGLSVIEEYATQPATLVYADPPYFEKSGSLYLNSFTNSDHCALAVCLNRLHDSKWVLTYDNVPQVAELYCERRRLLVSLNYSAHRVMKAKEIMVISDSLSDPLTLL